MMKLKTLKHVAAGISQSFVSRNNDVGGYWALGELYKECSAPDYAFLLSLLDGISIPSTPAASQVVKNYAMFLQRALVSQGIALGELEDANVFIQFDTASPERALDVQCQGDPFLCIVTLSTWQGKTAVAHAFGRCLRNRWGMFSRRAL
ncbi:hypothetical protein IV454_14475 [Massilia antarctica]|uniref:Uncharacterized protein n=1 Tax=Massilia antarctica TaxID=2765360 RepID=A0AA48WJL2_9BURK|nr:hypothetical protein [Massilia antarctica]QPI52584.1 hypothetical protein IV454_14475 [Massilia antarctica]